MLKIKYIVLIIFIVIINFHIFIINIIIFTNSIYASNLKYFIDKTTSNININSKSNVDDNLKKNTQLINNDNFKLSGKLWFVYNANIQKNIHDCTKKEQADNNKLDQYFSIDLNLKAQYNFPDSNSALNKKLFFILHKKPENDKTYKNIIAFQLKNENVKIITGYNYSILKDLIVLASNVSQNDCSEFIFVKNSLKKISIKNFANFISDNTLSNESLNGNSINNENLNNVNPISLGALFKKNDLKFGINYIHQSYYHIPFLQHNNNAVNNLANDDISVDVHKIYYKNIIELGANYIQDLKNVSIKYGFFIKHGQNDTKNNINTNINLNTLSNLNIYNFGIIINRNNFSIGSSISYLGENLFNAKLNSDNNLLKKSNNFTYHLNLGYTAWNMSLSIGAMVKKYNNMQIDSFNAQSSCKFHGFQPFVSYSIYKIKNQDANLYKKDQNCNTSLINEPESIRHLFILGLKFLF